MSTFTEKGKIDRHVANNGVSQVFVAEASRNAANGRPAREVRAEDEKVYEEWRKLKQHKATLQAELGQLNARLKGKTYSHPDYSMLIDRHARIKKEMAGIESQIIDMRGKVQEANRNTYQADTRILWELLVEAKRTNELLENLTKVLDRQK